jgi:hypothetical protein
MIVLFGLAVGWDQEVIGQNSCRRWERKIAQRPAFAVLF